jgi:hypothetical protein
MRDEILRNCKEEKARLLAESAPLRAERDKLADSIRPIEDKIRELNTQIRKIEQPRVGELDVVIVRLEYPLSRRSA